MQQLHSVRTQDQTSQNSDNSSLQCILPFWLDQFLTPYHRRSSSAQPHWCVQHHNVVPTSASSIVNSKLCHMTKMIQPPLPESFAQAEAHEQRGDSSATVAALPSTQCPRSSVWRVEEDKSKGKRKTRAAKDNDNDKRKIRVLLTCR